MENQNPKEGNLCHGLMQDKCNGHGRSQCLFIGAKIVSSVKHTSVAFEVSFFSKDFQLLQNEVSSIF